MILKIIATPYFLNIKKLLNNVFNGETNYNLTLHAMRIVL